MGRRPAQAELTAAQIPAAPAAWNFACPDWLERLKTGRSLVPDLPLNQAEADRAVGIFNRLVLPDVPGQPTMAEGAGDWFRDIIRAAFGSIDPVTRTRRVGEIFALVPKKNAKTTGGAGIMLTALLANDRPYAEMLFVGPTHDIAEMAFRAAVGMIESDPEGYLQKRFHVQEHKLTITDRLNKAFLKVKTFDMKVMTGAKPVVVLLDELHIMSLNSRATNVIGQIRGGFSANPESLLIIITTQSDNPPAGAFKAELTRARNIRDGRITGPDVRMLPILYEFPEAMQRDGDAWRDPANWPMVTPNLGRSISIEKLIADFRTAQDLGEEEVRRWASQHLNVEIGLALHADRWAGADYWEGAAEPGLTLETLFERCDVVTVGGDGGGLDDLFGLNVTGRCKHTRDWLSWSHAWAHRDVLTRRKDIAERLQDFERDGDLTIVDDPDQPFGEFAAIVKRAFDLGLLPEKGAVGLDPYGVAALVDALVEQGIPEAMLEAVPQGFKLAPAIWHVPLKLKAGTYRHCGQPLMTWCVGNAKTEVRGSAVVINKFTSGSAKIDPLVAAFNAAMLMARNPTASAGIDFDKLIMAGGGIR